MTTREVAARLGVSPTRVRQLIAARRLPAVRAGRDWWIREEDLAMLMRRPTQEVTLHARRVRR